MKNHAPEYINNRPPRILVSIALLYVELVLVQGLAQQVHFSFVNYCLNSFSNHLSKNHHTVLEDIDAGLVVPRKLVPFEFDHRPEIRPVKRHS